MNISKAPPDESTNFDLLKSEIFSGINCIKPGKIASIDLSSGSCTVEIVFKATIDNNQILSYPVLVDCPIFVLQGSGAFLELPIKKGDYCLVLFSDRDIDIWWTTGNEVAPNTKRKHSLSDGFALVGINTKISPLPLTGDPRFFSGALKMDFENNAKKMSVLIDGLFSLLDTLTDTVKNLVTVGSATTQTLDPTTIANLVSVKDDFDAKKAEFNQLLGSN